VAHHNIRDHLFPIYILLFLVKPILYYFNKNHNSTLIKNFLVKFLFLLHISAQGNPATQTIHTEVSQKLQVNNRNCSSNYNCGNSKKQLQRKWNKTKPQIKQ